MPAKKMTRIEIKLRGKFAKAFTSEGPLVSGSVVELPSEEAARLIAKGCAHLSDQEVARLEPRVNIEDGLVPAAEPDPE